MLTWHMETQPEMADLRNFMTHLAGFWTAAPALSKGDVNPGQGGSSMIRKSMPSGHDPMGGSRFSLATNAERVCAEIMRKQKDRAG
jgi:hypothetical protein